VSLPPFLGWVNWRSQRSHVRSARAFALTTAAVLVCALAGVGQGVAGNAAAAPLDATVYDASSYGAVCDGDLQTASNGESVDYNGIQDAINAAESNSSGGTVVLPAGTCMISESLLFSQGPGIVVEGAVSSSDQLLTTLTDPDNPEYRGGDLQVNSNHDTIQDLILNQSSYGGTAIVQADDTTFQDVNALGGKTYFSMYFTSLQNGQRATGNQLLNSTAVSLIDRNVLGVSSERCDDGLVWAEQDNSEINGLTFTGTRLALYQDTSTTVSNYTYYPGPQTCDLDGFYISQPSNDIQLDGLTLHGSAGVLGNGSTNNGTVSDVTISNEQVETPTAGSGYTLNGSSHGMTVRNVQGLTVENSNIDDNDLANSSIDFQPTASSDNVLIESTTVPRVSFWAMAPQGSKTLGTVKALTLSDDTFPSFSWPDSNANQTFLDGNATQAGFQVTGGTWSNQQPGKYFGFYKGSNATYTVSDLAGYP
jgi:hypothetical protein